MGKYTKLKEECPNAMELVKDFGIINFDYHPLMFQFFDKYGVRVFPKYGASGGFGVELYRKKTKEEYLKDNPKAELDLNWKMKRIGVIQTFTTREEAESHGFIKAVYELEILLNNK